ncbi:unnamed protein product, partial [Mesorhabditis spiculigera]
MWSILCLVALLATVFGSFNPNEPNAYQDWIHISIANQPGQQKLGYAVTKDAALLAKHNGTVVHKVVTNGADFSVTPNQYYGVRVVLEVPSMEAGKNYEKVFNFTHIDVLGLNFIEVIGNKDKKIEFIAPTQVVAFKYTKDAPEFSASFSTHELKDERAYLCPIPGYLTGGANGLLYDSTYPKNTDGFSYVCSQYFYSTEKGRNFWASGTLADGDQFYLRNMKTQKKIDVNVEPSKNTTIAFPPNQDFVLYFVGAKSPNKERKFNFAVQNNE